MTRKFAILGDIHANIDALDAVVEDARSQGVTDFLSVGDIVGYNAEPAACIAKIRELGCETVRGNHDHYASSPDVSLSDFHPLAAKVMEWTRRRLSQNDAEWLAGLPLEKRIAGFTLVHSTLDMPAHWGYVFDSLAAESNFAYQKTQVCFHGHTHVPIVYEKTAEVRHIEPSEVQIGIGRKFFINTGSVGQPRDGDPRASYAIYDMAERKVLFRRVAYDIEAAMERDRRAELPERLAARLAAGR